MKRIHSLAIALAFTASASAQSTPAFQASSSAIKPATQTQMNANAEFLFMLEQLQQEVQSLRGLVERQTHEIKQLKQQGRDRYRDLDQRLLKLQSGAVSSSVPVKLAPAAATSPVTATTTASAVTLSEKPSAEQQRAYQQAYDLIKQKKYEQAVDRLHKFIEIYPSSDLTGNAYYWLGEVYLVMPKFEQARQAFTVVVGSFSSHRKAPDAMYKLGVTYHRLGNLKEAKSYLSEVSKRYPESSAAKLAKEYKEKL
jgi:tol-pal system protein YbgF